MKYLLGLLIIFEITDGFLTHLLITSGIAIEGNPFLAPIVGDMNFLVLKVVGVLLAAVILWDIYRHSRKLGLAAAGGFAALYGFIVIWNFSLLVRPELLMSILK